MNIHNLVSTLDNKSKCKQIESAYLLDCFDPGLRCLMIGSEISDNKIYAVYDPSTAEIIQIEAWDCTNSREYRWVNPEFVNKNLDFNTTVDGRKFIDIECFEDIVEKSIAIHENKEYDARLMITVNLDDETELQLMRLAHQQDITLNQLIENIICARLNNA